MQQQQGPCRNMPSKTNVCQHRDVSVWRRQFARCGHWWNFINASENCSCCFPRHHLVCPPRNNMSGVVWWCQAPRAPHTIFSANADAVDNRGKGPGLSTLSTKCTHGYFLSTLLLCLNLWNIGQCGWRGFQVSGPTMTKRWGIVYMARCVCSGALNIDALRFIHSPYTQTLIKAALLHLKKTPQ